MKPYLVCFDTETTGLDVQRDWIIQLSLVKVDAHTFEAVGAYDWYIKPSGAYTIAPEAQAVHHITREVLEREGVALKDIYPQMMAFLQDCDILSYNGNGFDARILYYNLQREGLTIDYDAYRFYDAYLIEMARTSRCLTDVYRRYYGREFDDAHNSLADVRATIAVFKAQQEFVDIVAISQVTPGPIGINCATYVGYTATGSVWGSLLTTFAIILPSLIIMLAICRLYFFLSTRFRTNPYFQNTLRMLRFAVIGLIAAAALLLITPDSFIDWKSWLFFAVVFILTILPELTKGIKNKGVQQLLSSLSHPILLIILAGIAGYVVYN